MSARETRTRFAARHLIDLVALGSTWWFVFDLTGDFVAANFALLAVGVYGLWMFMDGVMTNG